MLQKNPRRASEKNTGAKSLVETVREYFRVSGEIPKGISKANPEDTLRKKCLEDTLKESGKEFSKEFL